MVIEVFNTWMLYLISDWFIRFRGRKVLKSGGICPANSAGLNERGLRSLGSVAHAGSRGIGTGMGPPHAKLRRSRQQYGFAVYRELVRIAIRRTERKKYNLKITNLLSELSTHETDASAIGD